mgnify:CR=1 FL=1
MQHMERRQLIRLVIPSALVIIVSIMTMKYSPSETLVPLPSPVSNTGNLTNSKGEEFSLQKNVEVLELLKMIPS